MFLVDTHTHIFSEEFDDDIAPVVDRAVQAGVTRCCLPNIDVESIDRLHRLTDSYPFVCFPMMGLHPTSVGEDYRTDLEKIRSCFDQRRYIAVGEIGIDLYWDKTRLREQTDAFEEQLRWSIEMDLPVAIHTREAFPQVFDSIRRVGADRLRGIFHSFGGSRAELEEALSFSNFLLGINGVATYKKAGFTDYLSAAPLERIVLETDAPYLTPVPFRGKRNEPSYLRYVLARLSEIYQRPEEELAAITTRNAEQLLGI